MFIFVYFFTQTDPTRTVQRSALCRSRRELSNSPCPFSQSSFRTDSYSNEYFLAKIGVDTAENEPLKVHLIFKLWDLIFTEPPRPQLPRCDRARAAWEEGKLCLPASQSTFEQLDRKYNMIWRIFQNVFFSFFSRGRFENKLRKNQTWSDAWP